MFFSAQVKFTCKFLTEVRKTQIRRLKSTRHLQDDLQTAQGCTLLRTVQRILFSWLRTERDSCSQNHCFFEGFSRFEEMRVYWARILHITHEKPMQSRKP